MKFKDLQKANKLANEYAVFESALEQLNIGSSICLTGSSGNGNKGFQLHITITEQNFETFATMLGNNLTKIEIQMEAIGIELPEEEVEE